MIMILLGMATASPSESARVIRLYEPGENGKWVRVDESDGAWVLVDGVEQRLTEGAAVEYRQTLRSDTARAVIKLRTGARFTLEPGSSLELHAPAWVFQHQGAVDYDVKGYFTVEYGWVKCTAQGTRFSVEQMPSTLPAPEALAAEKVDASTLSTKDDVRVRVDKGMVHANNPRERRFLSRDQQATFPQFGVPSDG